MEGKRPDRDGDGECEYDQQALNLLLGRLRSVSRALAKGKLRGRRAQEGIGFEQEGAVKEQAEVSGGRVKTGRKRTETTPKSRRWGRLRLEEENHLR